MSDPEMPYLGFSQVAPLLALVGLICFFNIIFCCYLIRLRRRGVVEVGYKIVQFDAKKITNDICAVCLEEFEPREKISMCRCKHAFHVICISKWLSSKQTCPICNTQVKPLPTETTFLVPSV